MRPRSSVCSDWGTFRRSPAQPPTESRCWRRLAAPWRPPAPSPAPNPDSALVLAYDAARYAATALLAQQGLRPTTAGGHVGVESAIRAQFGDGFRGFSFLRRRRNELEYPSTGTAASDVDEANEPVAESRGIVEAAEQLLPNLGFFG